MSNSTSIPIVELDINRDCLSRCPLCNAAVFKDAVVIRSIDTKQMSVAHQTCVEELENDSTLFFVKD